MALGTHGDYIVLANWEFMLQASWPDIPLTHTILTLSDFSILLMKNLKIGFDKYYFWGVNWWFDSTGN